jgi:hypothetical protein
MESQFDAGIGEGERVGAELLRKALGNAAGNGGRQKVQKGGRRAGEGSSLLDESAGGLCRGVEGRRVGEGLTHFLLGAAEGGSGGHGPGERIGGPATGQIHFGQAAEGGADGGAERGEDGRLRLNESVAERGFGAPRVWGEG